MLKEPTNQNGADKPQQVRDPIIERGISINTLLTGLILFVTTGVGGWVGYNIEQIKKDVNTFAVTLAVTQRNYDVLDKQLNEHTHDPFAHVQLRRRSLGD